MHGGEVLDDVGAVKVKLLGQTQAGDGRSPLYHLLVLVVVVDQEADVERRRQHQQQQNGCKRSGSRLLLKVYNTVI